MGFNSGFKGLKYVLLKVNVAKSRNIGQNVVKTFRYILLKLHYKHLRANAMFQIVGTFVKTTPIQKFISVWKMVPELGLWDYTAKIPVSF